MGRGEGLVQIDMHGIDAESSRLHPADDGVEIRAVAVEIGAHRVHRLGDGDHVALEQAACVRIGQHDPGHVRPERSFQRAKIDASVLSGPDGLDGESTQSRRRRIRAMRGFRNQDACALLAARLNRRSDSKHPAQFTMRACLGRHRHRRHAGELFQPARQLGDQRERALHRLLRLQRMDVGKTGEPRQLLVQARVMLHGAGPERIKARIDRGVALRQPHIMAHRLRLREAGKADRLFARAAAEPIGRQIHLRKIDPGDMDLADLEDQFFLMVEAAMARDGFGSLVRHLGRSGLPLRVHHASTSPSARP